MKEHILAGLSSAPSNARIIDTMATLCKKVEKIPMVSISKPILALAAGC